MAEFFPGVVNSVIYVSRGTTRGKGAYFEKSKESFLSDLGKKISPFPTKKFPERLSKPIFSLPDQNLERTDFFWKTLVSAGFFGFWAGKFRQGCETNSPRWQNNNWGKWFSLRMIIFFKLFSNFEQNFSSFGRKNWWKMSILYSQRRDDQIPEKYLFLGINWKFQFILGFRSSRMKTISGNQSARTFEIANNASRGTARGQNVFLEELYF